MTLKLSDAYKEFPEAASGLGGFLELAVRVVNINEGRNDDIVGKCGTLNGYVRFVGKVRSYLAAGRELSDAVTQAVKDCVSEGILEDFLKSHSSEVVNMLTAEWDINIAREVWTQEGREEGREEGIEVGREEGIEVGMDISVAIIRALSEHVPVEEISARLNTPVDKIKQIQAILALSG
jgi:hypothetical protein